MSTDTSSDPPSEPPAPSVLIAFAGHRRIATGTRDEVLAVLRAQADGATAVVFEQDSGTRVELDLRPEGSGPEHAPDEAPARGVGRPKLGVVAREVTLLPRHWDWLSRQPGGASVALRRLIDEARRNYAERDSVRAAREAAYRVMSLLGSELPGFEEASRSLFAGERARFDSYVSDWPADLAQYVRQLAEPGWDASTPPSA
ncbi:DUF2239 family protein [Xenophilus arseniciresistens]|uniref:DUF2239 family protein n=1 Tax=Xenophilus arseniciresistens TaxID=1283306 RepID=A0AAE3T1Q1_9BURK|nr:DUF2239 family protein [Xenophilus arseniciresistens]MDA7417607.1 DUF2239 family protein [Xenophilus arseniciresistens]